MHVTDRQRLQERLRNQSLVRALGLELSQTSKRLNTFVESNDCFAGGVSMARGCWVARRTLRLVDYGKVAATFVDTKTERAVRA